MRVLDEQERKIIHALIRNPRLSDNRVSKKTGVPLKTVNRKRKALENEGILHYATYLDYTGLGSAGAKQMFILMLKAGISRKILLDSLIKGDVLNNYNHSKHFRYTFFGEIDGHITLIFFVQSRVESDLAEILNADLVPQIRNVLGDDAIYQTRTINISIEAGILHNYIPPVNLKKGTIKSDWPDDMIYVE